MNVKSMVFVCLCITLINIHHGALGKSLEEQTKEIIKDKLQECIEELRRQSEKLDYKKRSHSETISSYSETISFDPNLLLNWIDYSMKKISFHSLREECFSKPPTGYYYLNYEEIDRRESIEKSKIKECAEKERMYFIIKMCHKFKSPEEKSNFELSHKLEGEPDIDTECIKAVDQGFLAALKEYRKEKDKNLKEAGNEIGAMLRKARKAGYRY